MVNEATKQELKRLYDIGYSRHKLEKTLNLTKKEMDEYIATLNIHFMSRDEIQERNMRMLEIRNTEPSPSLEAIGEMFPVNGRPMTKEGVRLAINNAVAAGGKLTAVRGKSPDKPNKHTTNFASRKTSANEMFTSGMSISEISKKLKVCEKTVVSYIKDNAHFVSKKNIKNQPSKSKLSYAEIATLKENGRSPQEISDLADISVPRVLQIFQLNGNYRPNKKTVQKMKRVLAAKENKDSIREIAKKEGVTEGQIYRYINLGRILEDQGKL